MVTPARERLVFVDVALGEQHEPVETEVASLAGIESSAASGASPCASARRRGIRDGDAEEMTAAAWALVHGLSALLIDHQLEHRGRTTRDADTLAGLYRGVACEVALSDAGQPVREHSGAGLLRVDAVRTGEAAR